MLSITVDPLGIEPSPTPLQGVAPAPATPKIHISIYSIESAFDRQRSDNLVLKRDLLCQLSYEGIGSCDSRQGVRHDITSW